MADRQETAKTNTSLTAFEHLVFGGDYGAAMAMLLAMLDAIEHGAEIPQDTSGETGARAYFTRFAAAIAALLANDPGAMAPSTVDRLAFHNRHIAAVFRLSGYADSGQLYKLVFGVRNRHTDEATAARILSAASIASPDDINWPELLRVTRSAASSAFLAQFSHRAPLSDGAERQRLAMLNVAFLASCRDIESSSVQSVEFHFFPNERGIRHRDCALQVKRILPDAVVHERTDYDAYLDLLNRCDIRLGTFPFGGANTTMDAYLLGIPTITLAGAEPHSRTDARFVSLFDMPDWLVADDEDSYRKAACRLIGDNAERITLSRRILDAIPERILFEKEQAEYPTDFADTLWWAYTRHDAILGSDRRVWRHEDRVAFTGDKR